MVRIARPEGPVKKNAREFALLVTMDLQNSGDVSAETLKSMAKYGDESKVSALAQKSEASFEDFAAAFAKPGTCESADGSGNAVGYAARDKSGKMTPFKLERRVPRDDDVVIQITWAGMCHSDVHTIRSEWGETNYPLIPGHEMIGIVTETGKGVKKFKVGDSVGVGCMVHSCKQCTKCKEHSEQYCESESGFVGTYGAKMPDGEVTQGGYSTFIIVEEDFVLKVPTSIHGPGAAPLLCAGITTYSPMRHYGIDKQGMKIGVVGLGGLGHMVVKFAKAFGQEVTVLSRSYKKKEDAMKNLGADNFLASSDEEAMKKAKTSFDAIIDTVSAEHDANSFLSLLKTDGQLIFLGVPPVPHQISAANIIFHRLKLGGSLIGGIEETQEMLDFCAEHEVLCQHEVVPAERVNEAVDRMVDGDVKYRFVIDTLGSLVYSQ